MLYKGMNWKYYHGALLPDVAPHVNIVLTANEEKELLRLSRVYFLRYTSDWDRKEESHFWYVIKDKFHGMEELSSNTRSKTRRGLNHCSVKKVTKNVIADYGFEVYRQAFRNYNTYLEPMTREDFINNILGQEKCDFWAVYKQDEDKMIAYSQNYIENNSINYSTIKFHPDYLKLYPSYALFFEMNQYYLGEKNFLYVNDGARSISHDTNIQTFLIDKFNFRKAFCKLHIVYRWDIVLAIKVLYPFKSLFSKIDYQISNKISILLNQEEIRRSFGK